MEGRSFCCVNLLVIYIIVLIISNLDFTMSVMRQSLTEKNNNSETITFNLPSTTPKPVNCTHIKSFDHSSVSSECKNTSPTNTSVNSSSSDAHRTSSEVENMNIHSYEGGQDVDELGKGNFSEKIKSREEAVEERVKNNLNPRASEIKQDNNGDEVSNKLSKLSEKTDERAVAMAVAAGICGVLAISAYAGILIWRKFSRVHYGHQEELINDDDLGDINDSDLHHFEGASIQIET